MKKSVFVLMGLALVLSACSRGMLEKEVTTEVDQIGEPTEEMVRISITGSILNDKKEVSEEETKTDYTFTEDKALFSWSTDDKVALVVYQGAVTKQDRYQMSLISMSDDKKTAQFDGLVEQHNAEGDWKSTGFAVYPVAISAQNDNSNHLTSYVKLPSSVTGEKSSVIMVGTPNDETAPDNFEFRVATSVLRVTVTGIPADATELRLSTSDNTNYPVDGDFSLVKGDGPVTIGLENYLGWGNGYQSVNLSNEGAIESREFLFNIPVGEYPKNTLSITLYGSDNSVLMTKKIAKAFNFQRNHFVTPPALATEWITLGKGKYADYWLQGFVGALEDMWDVTVQKSTSENKYRLINPYSHGVEMLQTKTHDDYLYFTINDNLNVSFEDFKTGVEYLSHNMELHYDSSSVTKVVKGSVNVPEIIQFAPVYRDADNHGWYYTRSGRNYMIRLVMPDYVGAYTSNVTITGSASSCDFSYTTGSSSKTIFFISNTNYPAYIISKGDNDINPVAGDFSSIYWSGRTSPGSISYSGSNLASKLFSSGPIYICWCTYDEPYSPIYTLGSKRMFFLSPSDISSLCKQHISTGHKGSSNQGDVISGSYTFAVSDNPLTGNIKMVEFDGMTPTITSLDASHQIFSSLYWVAPNNSTYTGANPVYGTGSAQEGIYNSSTGTILLDATKPFFKIGSVNIYVYSYTDYAGGGRGAANDPNHFKFVISDGKVNVGETYVNARFDGNNGASAPYANNIVEN